MLMFLFAYLVRIETVSLTLKRALKPLGVAVAALVLITGLTEVFERPKALLYIMMAAATLAPVAAGFGLSFRMGRRNERAVFAPAIVGCLYAAIQPLAYITELDAFELGSEWAHMRGVVAIVLASLKVLWAIVCTRVLSAGCLIGVPWRSSVAGHAVALIALYLSNLVLFLLPPDPYSHLPEGFEQKFSLVTGLLGATGFLLVVWDKLMGHGRQGTGPPDS